MGEDQELVAELWRNSTVIVSVAQKTSRDTWKELCFLQLLCTGAVTKTHQYEDFYYINGT